MNSFFKKKNVNEFMLLTMLMVYIYIFLKLDNGQNSFAFLTWFLQVLADTIDLPCRIARGCKYCTRDDASSCLVRFGLDK